MDRTARSLTMSGEAAAAAHRELTGMPRARWFVIGFLLVAVVGGALLNARGPFDAHPSIGYDRFVADVQAGKVDQIVWWRDQLEVTEPAAVLSVVVPATRDLRSDLARAHVAGGVGTSYATLPDVWIGEMTPWIPALIALAAVLLWASVVVRARRSAAGAGLAGSRSTEACPGL